MGVVAVSGVRPQSEGVVVRWLLLSPLAGLIAWGGVALADDAGIVDVSSSSGLSGWFDEPSPSPTPASGVPAAIAHATKSDSRPSVSPLAPAVPGDPAVAVEPWKAIPLELSPDPWISSRPAGAPVLASVAQERNWAYPIREIIDPWRFGAGAVTRDPLIVDPWAR
jgi:hypothetical protein